jgi:DNA-binding transcriptional LysR family regulator
MDRLDELLVFITIFEAGSLAAAGRRLRRSPPAITRILGALEDRVGARLVERTTRRTAPTEAGRRLAEQARRLLSDYDEVLREVGAAGTVLRGTLRVTAPLVFGRRHVTPIVTDFLDSQPGVQIDLLLNDRNLDLIEEGLDVAVRIGRLADSTLIARRVGEVRRVLVASSDYLSEHGTPASLKDLANHQLVFLSGRPTPLEWRFPGKPGRRDEVVRITPRLSVNEVEAMLLALRAGRGIGRVLSYQVADDLAAGRLVRLLRPFEPAALPVQLVVSSARHMAPKVRAFLDHATASLSSLDVIGASP